MCRHQKRSDDSIFASITWVSALQMNLMKLFTFQISFDDFITSDSMIISHINITHSYLQSFDRGRFMRRMMKIFPILSQNFLSQRLKNQVIQFFGDSMSFIEMKSN